MSQSTPTADLTTTTATATPPSAGAQTVQAAPAAVKRSMPMALSILLGILLAALASWLFKTLAWFLLLLYLSFVAATVLEAPVGWLARHHFRRGLAAALVMVTGLVLVLALAAILANGLYNQGLALSDNLQKAPQRINQFVNDLGGRFPALGDRLKSFDIAENVAQSMPSLATIWQNAVFGFSIVSSLVVSFFIVLYMLIDGPSHLQAARGLLPKSSRLEATRMVHNLAKAHRGWALASAINVSSATLLISSGLWLLNVPGALILGFLAGLGELIPNVGPFFGALPAILFTLLMDPKLFPYVLVMFIIVQTLQSYTITPLVLKISVELPVLVTIIAVLVMGALFGLLGILAAIPLVTDMVVFWNYLAAQREKDTTDYDRVNGAANGTRESVPHEPAHPSRFRKLFHRRRPRANPNDVPAPGSGLDRLEKAEQRAKPPAERR